VNSEVQAMNPRLKLIVWVLKEVNVREIARKARQNTTCWSREGEKRWKNVEIKIIP
jgi:hypothetical protein